jgi:NAD(P)-dependent dehydrogenase (short-subunit alcohol dehydrogenase family)
MAFDDYNAEADFSALDVFGRSKSANNLMAAELAERLARKGICVNAVDPGFVKTTLTREAPLPLRIIFAIIGQSRHQGARWPLFVATAPELAGVTGKFFLKAKETPFPPPARDEAARKRLLRDTERLLGIS